jgi:hypothetical protein
VVAYRRPTPLSQGYEVRASSEEFDTGGRDKFPKMGKNRQRWSGGMWVVEMADGLPPAAGKRKAVPA